MPYCGNIAALELFILTGATALSIASINWSSIFLKFPVNGTKRNTHLKYGAFLSSICGIISIAINISSAYTEDPVGLGLPRSMDFVSINSVSLFWSVCLVSLASFQRYSSYFTNKSRDFIFNMLSRLVILWFAGLSILGTLNGVLPPASSKIVCTNGTIDSSDNISIICNNGQIVHPTQSENVNVLYILTGILPILHILFSVKWIHLEIYSSRNNQISSLNAGNLDLITHFAAAIFVLIAWIVYFLLVFCSWNSNPLRGVRYPSTYTSNPGLFESGLLGSLYLLCNNFALACESSISSETLNLHSLTQTETEEEDNTKDQFSMVSTRPPEASKIEIGSV